MHTTHIRLALQCPMCGATALLDNLKMATGYFRIKCGSCGVPLVVSNGIVGVDYDNPEVLKKKNLGEFYVIEASGESKKLEA